MDANKSLRTGRSLFELGEIRGNWQSGRSSAPSSAERPVSGPERPAGSGMEARLKNVALTERQLSLAIGAIERVIEDLRSLPGTEATVKEYEASLYTMRQALAVLPAANG